MQEVDEGGDYEPVNHLMPLPSDIDDGCLRLALRQAPHAVEIILAVDRFEQLGGEGGLPISRRYNMTLFLKL